MGKKIAFSFLLALLSFSGFTQNQKSLIDYDRETYQLFLAEQWKELIDRGQKALDENVDFFYLRMRMGLAYYNLQNYELARLYFLGALEFVSGNHDATFYLYYSNLLSGRVGEARSLLSNMSDEIRNVIGAAGKYSISHLSAETGNFTNQSYEEMRTQLPEGDYVSSYFLKNMNFNSISGGINIGYSSNLMISVNRYDFQNTQVVSSYGELSEFEHNNSQNGFYLRYLYSMPDSWYGGFSFHTIKGNFNVNYYVEQPQGDYDFEDILENYQHTYYGAYFGKHFKYGDLSMSLSENNFWQGAYYQLGSNLYAYPFGNTKYFLGAGYHLIFPQEKQGGRESVYKVVAGVTIFKGLLLEGNYIKGNLSNWADIGGLYLFNTRLPVLSRAGLSLIYSGIGNKLQLSLSAFSQNRIHEADIFYLDGSIESIESNFITNSIFGGLTWIF